MTALTLKAPVLSSPIAVSRVETTQSAPNTQLPASQLKAASPSYNEQKLDDEGLIVAICDGAEWAMERLYQRYSRYAYSIAYRLLHDGTAAEDIVQDAFLAIWRKAGSYQKQHGSVCSWLQAIVHHRAIDKIRAANHRDHQWTSLQEENGPELESEQPDVWEEAWHDEQRTLIRKVLTQLPAEQRQVIELAYFGGYTHSEIAEQWHIPLGTVKGRLRLGIQKMKHLLQDYGLESAY